jgi:hypothetical protein
MRSAHNVVFEYWTYGVCRLMMQYYRMSGGDTPMMAMPASGERPNRFQLDADGDWLYIGSEVCVYTRVLIPKLSTGWSIFEIVSRHTVQEVSTIVETSCYVRGQKEAARFE